MTRFSPNLKNRYPDLACGDFERLLEQAACARQGVIRAADFSPVAKIPFKVRMVFQIALRRNLELAAAFVNAFNGELFVPLFVEARAMLETGCLAWDVRDRVEQVLIKGGTGALSSLDQHIGKVLLGAKTKEWVGDPNRYPAPNVLTIVDRLCKSLEPKLRDYYEVVSEFAHPNYSGMQAAYSDNDKAARESRFIDRPFHENARLLDIAFGCAGAGLRMSVASIEYYERELAAFTRLCEEELHDQGTWPINIPYPRL